MKHFRIAYVLFAISFSAYANDKNEMVLVDLKREVEKKGIYIEAKYQKIDSLRKIYNNLNNKKEPTLQFEICVQLYQEYRSFIYDSAFNYALKSQKLAHSLKDDYKIALSKINFGFILVSSGMLKEAFDTLETLNTSAMPATLLKEYYPLMERTYFDLVDYNTNPFYMSKYDALKKLYIDSTLSLYEPNSMYYLYFTGIKNIESGNIKQAQVNLEELIAKFKLENHLYAMATSSLSYVYLCTGLTDKAIEMLAESVKADIKSCTKETMAAYKLAELLYTEGNTNDAHFFIKLAMDDAYFYNSNLRKKQISSIMPVIEGTQLDTAIRQKKLLFRYAVATTLLSILVFVLLFFTFKTIRKLKSAEKIITSANNKLLESNKIKDEYIGYYFNNNSEYIDKIEKFKKSIIRILMTKRYDDIENIINNINPQKEREELFNGFDKVFVRLFPDFVERFNALLKDDDKIILKENQLLNTDLRIFALIRIGINDHEKIAKILGYSVSTIYNYKTKIRNKSIVPHDKFEEEIMSVKAI